MTNIIKLKTKNHLLFILNTLIYGKFFPFFKYFLKTDEQDINRRFKNASLFRDVIIAKIFSLIIDDRVPVYFLDIGANVGEFGRVICEHIPVTNIVYIEPNPSLIEALKYNSKKYSANILQYAVSDICANQILSFDLTHSGGGSISNDYQNNNSSESVEVKTVTLDYLNSINNLISQVNNVKIDVEGHELSVFKGGLEFFKKNRPTIVFELSTNDFVSIANILNDYSFYQVTIPGLDYDRNILKRILFLFYFILSGSFFIKKYNTNNSYCSGIFAIPNENLNLFLNKLSNITLKKINFY